MDQPSDEEKAILQIIATSMGVNKARQLLNVMYPPDTDIQDAIDSLVKVVNKYQGQLNPAHELNLLRATVDLRYMASKGLQ